MKYCPKCKVNIAQHLTYCPLCQSELIEKDSLNNDIPETESIFPNTYEIYTSHHMVLKIVGFIALSISIICIFANFLFPAKVWWSLVVTGTMLCTWCSLAVAISKRRNILKYLLYQSIIICIFAVFIDIFTGFTGWSITFVLPIVFTVAMILMYILSKILHLQAGDYIIYLLLDEIFGILPLFLLLMDHLTVRVPSLICLMVSTISVISLIIFEGKSMYQELYRRLHI